jgi:hypothetical protein
MEGRERAGRSGSRLAPKPKVTGFDPHRRERGKCADPVRSAEAWEAPLTAHTLKPIKGRS